MGYRAVMHFPSDETEKERLFHEIARYRAEKVIKHLLQYGITTQQLQDIIREIQQAP